MIYRERVITIIWYSLAADAAFHMVVRLSTRSRGHGLVGVVVGEYGPRLGAVCGDRGAVSGDLDGWQEGAGLGVHQVVATRYTGHGTHAGQQNTRRAAEPTQ